MEELASKVSALNRVTSLTNLNHRRFYADSYEHPADIRKITIDIQNEVHGQHAILDQNSNSFNEFGTSFATTVKKLDVMVSQKLGRSMCWMVSAIVILFFIVYFILARMNSA
ncbi:hypothetical protein BGZ97_010141 [Linnemannia gamsii]|uniref:t-SNARE coiled-coil homology domain-containing protein n=1 Tax=Linnemannia gamsii TaxID=64522 RepID=A0A9P6R658_9FUNG|nr:hypothetical protein BGZ97_010141 [Linnemannia gamsii]